MKRFHVHVAVPDLNSGVRFYASLFGVPPSVLKADYAKWMLEDPRINFAISQRSGRSGVNHLGLQTDSDAELDDLNAQLQRASLTTLAEKDVSCCYARSNKYWITDPAGVAWETFHSLGSVPTYDGAAATAAPLPQADATQCCGPASATSTGAAACCG